MRKNGCLWYSAYILLILSLLSGPVIVPFFSLHSFGTIISWFGKESGMNCDGTTDAIYIGFHLILSENIRIYRKYLHICKKKPNICCNSARPYLQRQTRNPPNFRSLVWANNNDFPAKNSNKFDFSLENLLILIKNDYFPKKILCIPNICSKFAADFGVVCVQ